MTLLIRADGQDGRTHIERMMPRYLAGLGAPPGVVYPDLGAYGREPSRLAYLTVHDGSVAGFALVHGPTDEAMFELVEFYVAPRLRRRGLGRKAAAELFALHPATWLIAVRDDNPSGQAFWSSALAGRDMTVGEVARPPGKLYRVSVDADRGAGGGSPAKASRDSLMDARRSSIMRKVDLHPIDRAGATTLPQALPEVMRQNCALTAAFYGVVGFEPPWIGYVCAAEECVVGGGAFKGPPADNRVEIAYYTLPDCEGQGWGMATARGLVEMANAAAPGIVVAAQTLPHHNASTRILQKLGFAWHGTVQHPEDGEVWEWRLPHSR